MLNQDKFVLHCPSCHKATISTTLDQARVEDEVVSTLFSFVRCDECHRPAVLWQEETGGGWDDPTLVWPGEDRVLSHSVPIKLRREAEEARACYRARAYAATVVMVRRTLEGICQDHGISEQNLMKALKKMLEAGHLESRLLEWSQALRTLGNSAAHFTGQLVSREDARDALDLAEAMLEYTYALSAKFEAFKTRRKGSSTGLEQE